MASQFTPRKYFFIIKYVVTCRVPYPLIIKNPDRAFWAFWKSLGSGSFFGSPEAKSATFFTKKWWNLLEFVYFFMFNVKRRCYSQERKSKPDQLHLVRHSLQFGVWFCFCERKCASAGAARPSLTLSISGYSPFVTWSWIPGRRYATAEPPAHPCRWR